jgi:hypothetical protein
MSNSLMPAFKNAPKKVKSEKPRKNVKQQKFSKFEGKNCTSNILQKVKCYFWPISIIPHLIPSEMSIEAPLLVCSVCGCWDRAQLRLRHWLLDAITTWLDLILKHKKTLQ